MGFLDIIKKLFNNNKKTAKILTTDFNKIFGTSDAFKIILVDTNDNPIPNKEIKIKTNNVLYKKNTDENGVATLNINLQCGQYPTTIEFEDDEYKVTRSYSDIIVSPQIETKDLNMQEKDGSKFQAHLTDVYGNEVPYTKVIFQVNGVPYEKITDENGFASLNINLAQGDYTILTTSYGTSKTNTIHISQKVQNSNAKHFGYWVFGRDMLNVDLDNLKKHGVTDIFLNYYALTTHGEEKVRDWITKADNIKIHIWMQCFYDGEWHNPKTTDLNPKIEEAKKYASINGIAGVHLDYLRYPGNAYKTEGGAEAITDFVSKVKNAIPSNIQLSCAIMPEKDTKKYYGQDVEALGQIVNFITPMQYKGNYNAGTNWLASTTKNFAQKANIWSGLQAYKSDDDTTLLSESELQTDIKTCLDNNAKGILLFRYGLSPNINFNEFQPSQNKIPTKMEGIDINMTYKDGTQYQCAVYDTNGRIAVPVNITVNGKTYTKTPDITGLYKLNINLNPGNYTIDASFAGNDTYLGSSVRNNITINEPKKEEPKQESYELHEYFTQQGGGKLGQTNGSRCAPHSVMQCYYRLTGIDVSEAELASVMGTTEAGTGHSGIETGVAWLNKKYGTNVKIKWMNFSDLGSTQTERFAKMQELINKGALFIHELYRDKWGHYSVPKETKNNPLIILNSLGEYCNYPAYCGYIESRERNDQISYINGISQKSVAYLYR